MPDAETLRRARRDARQGKSASTQAGEFVREEMHHIREGKHGARSAKQAVAIGLSKARRAGVALPPPKGKVSASTRHHSEKDFEKGQTHTTRRTSTKRSRATLKALKREPRSAASPTALSRQAHKVASQRTAGERSASARKAAHTRQAELV